MDCGFIISKAIRECRWVSVSYKNKSDEIANFFFCVKDIFVKEKKLIGDQFNPHLKQSFPFLANTTIFFDKIKNAYILDNTFYDVPEKLLNKLESLPYEEDYLHFNELDNNIFLYLEKCVENDGECATKSFAMVEGIDESSFENSSEIEITDEQCKLLLKEFDNFARGRFSSEKRFDKAHNYYNIKLAFNILSAKKADFILPIVYKNIILKISTPPRLCIENKLYFEKSFLLDKRGDSNIGFNADEFIETYKDNAEEWKEIISENLNNSFILNTKPEIMQLGINYKINFREITNSITNMIKTKTVTHPIKAFLGYNVKRRGRPKNITLVTYNNLANIDQVRVVFNALRENVTYVEGPPGTGKTQTILNVIFSAFFSSETTLVCSGNNFPIDSILNKITNEIPPLNGENILFPVFRVGNRDVMEREILYLRKLCDKAFQKGKPNKSITVNHQILIERKTQDLEVALEKYEKRKELCLELSSLEIWEKFSDSKQLCEYLSKKKFELQNKINQIDEITNEDVVKLCISGYEDKNFLNYLYYHSIELLQCLQNEEYEEFLKIIYESDIDKAISKLKLYLLNSENIYKLQKVFPVWISTNISAQKIGEAKPYFDLCIMDESGQCDIARSLIPIIRSKKLLLVGDTQQLRPVILLPSQKQKQFQKEFNIANCDIYDYINNSILSLMKKADTISNRILLSYHYRCAKPIINFSNKYYYDEQLKVHSSNNGSVKFFDVNNFSGPKRNSFYEETEAIIELLKRRKDNSMTLGIITPFRNQVELLQKRIDELGIKNVHVGTIHTVQGAEYDTIIFSAAVANSSRLRTFDWVKNNDEIINVGITRAKKNLFVVADKKAIFNLSKNKTNALKDLTQYASSKNNGVKYELQTHKKRSDFSNNSEYEREFYSTISQVLTKTKNLVAKRNVKMKDVLYNVKSIFDDYYYQSEFDIVIYEKTFDFLKPILIIEVDGGEHYAKTRSARNDEKKQKLCKESGIKLFRIPNSFVSRYDIIKKFIANIPTDFGQTTFDFK